MIRGTNTYISSLPTPNVPKLLFPTPSLPLVDRVGAACVPLADCDKGVAVPGVEAVLLIFFSRVSACKRREEGDMGTAESLRALCPHPARSSVYAR